MVRNMAKKKVKTETLEDPVTLARKGDEDAEAAAAMAAVEAERGEPIKRLGDDQISVREQIAADLSESRGKEITAEDEEGEAAEVVAEGEAAEVVAEGEAAEVVAEGEAAEVVAEGEAAEVVAEGEAAEVVAEGEAAEVVAEGEAAEVVDDTLKNFIYKDKQGKPMLVVKIDGKSMGVPLEQAQSELQKGVAGDQRLRVASQQKSEIDKQRIENETESKRLAELAASLKNQSSAEEIAATTKQNDEALRKKVSEFSPLLTEGSDDAIGDALFGLLKEVQGAQPEKPATQVQPEDIAKTVAPMIENKLLENSRQLDADQGLSSFKKDYPDLDLSDPIIFGALDSVAQGIEAESPNLMPSEVMDQAGEKVMQWRKDNFKPDTIPNDENSEEARLVRKKDLSQQLPSVSVKVPKKPQVATDESREEKNAEYIRSLNKARGIAA